MITQPGQLLFYRGVACTISVVEKNYVIAQNWKGTKDIKIRIKDISVYPQGNAWKASKAIKITAI